MLARKDAAIHGLAGRRAQRREIGQDEVCAGVPDNVVVYIVFELVAVLKDVLSDEAEHMRGGEGYLIHFRDAGLVAADSAIGVRAACFLLNGNVVDDLITVQQRRVAEAVVVIAVVDRDPQIRREGAVVSGRPGTCAIRLLGLGAGIDRARGERVGQALVERKGRRGRIAEYRTFELMFGAQIVIDLAGVIVDGGLDRRPTPRAAFAKIGSACL